MADSDDTRDANGDESIESDEADAETSSREPAEEPTAGRTTGDRDDGIDVASLANHSVYVSLVFAAAGLGFGLFVFLMAQFGADATFVPGQNQSQEAFITLFINNSLNVALIFPLFLAPVTGLVVNFSVEDDATALFAAAVGGFVGAVLFVMLAGITADLQYPMVQTMNQTVQGAFRLEEGLVNSLLVGFVTALVGGVSAVIGQLLE